MYSLPSPDTEEPRDDIPAETKDPVQNSSSQRKTPSRRTSHTAFQPTNQHHPPTSSYPAPIQPSFTRLPKHPPNTTLSQMHRTTRTRSADWFSRQFRKVKRSLSSKPSLVPRSPLMVGATRSSPALLQGQQTSPGQRGCSPSVGGQDSGEVGADDEVTLPGRRRSVGHR